MQKSVGYYPRLGRLARNASIYSLGEVLIRVITFALLPLYTIVLPPEDLAIWGLGFMGLQLATVVYGAGMPAGLVQIQYELLDDEEKRRQYNGSVLAFLLVWPLALHAALEVVAPALLAEHLPLLPWHPYGRLLSLAGLFGTLAVLPVALWTSSERPKPYVLLGLLRSLIEAGLTVLLLLGLGAGVLSIFVGKLAGAAVLAVPLLVYSLRHVKLGMRRAHVLHALAFAVPLVPHLLSTWALGMADRLLLAALAPPAALGLYTAAYWFPMAINTVAMSANRAWSPVFHKEIDDPARRAHLRTSTTWFTVVIVVLATGTAAVAPDIVVALFHEQYRGAVSLVRLLAFGAGFQGLYYVFVAALYKRQRRFAIPAATLVSALVNVGLNVLWIPRWGAEGAAASTLLCYALMTALVFTFSRRVLPVPLDVGLLLRALLLLVTAFFTSEALAGAMAGMLDLPLLDALARVAMRVVVFAALLGAGLGRELLTLRRAKGSDTSP